MQDQTLSGSHQSHVGHCGCRMRHQDPQCGSTVTCPLALQISSATDSCTGIVPHQQHTVPQAIAHTEHHPVPKVSACTEHQSSSSAALSLDPGSIPMLPACPGNPRSTTLSPRLMQPQTSERQHCCKPTWTKAIYNCALQLPMVTHRHWPGSEQAPSVAQDIVHTEQL